MVWSNDVMTKAMLRVLVLIGVLALVCFGASALAEEGAGDGLDVVFSISPAELVGPGDVTMTFVITNHSEQDIRNIYLTSDDGLLSEPVGQMAPGESQTLVRPHAVTQAELDEGRVRYVISHDASDAAAEKVSHNLSAPVIKGDARPDVDFTRQLSSRFVPAGGQLTITYRVSNNGNVPVSAVSIHDALGDFTGRLEQLPIGGTRTFISRVTVNMESSSDAVLEYTVPSGETISRRLDPVTVRLSESALEHDFSVGRSAFDPERADAVLILTNAGNDDYSDITVLDDVYGGVIADGLSLPRGSNPTEVAFTYPVRGDGEYRWRVTGVSQAGEAVDFVTETLTLPAEELPRSIDISMYIAPRASVISRPGNVTFDIALTNEGTASAKELQLYEVERGNARALAVLPTGEPCRFSVTYEVKQDSQFIFCLNYLDEEGHPRTISAEPIDITIGPGGMAPEPLDSERMRLEGSSTKPGSSSTFTILLVVASAALVSMFTLLLVTALRARQDRRRRAAEQRQRRQDNANQPRRKAAKGGKKGETKA